MVNTVVRLLIMYSSMMWCDMDPYDWLKKFPCMAAVVSIISRFGLKHVIETNLIRLS